MSEHGMIFDIVEFTINDGPGVRVSVFMKGCPLRCMWCHNPEGLSKDEQLNIKSNRIVGKLYSVEELVKKINKYKDTFDFCKGGVTFTGGEPSYQSEFIYNVAKNIPDIHKTLDTCGYCDNDIFKKLLSVFDLVYFDIKLVNNDKHIQYTSCSNELILNNLKYMVKNNIQYHVRIPLITDITDTTENLNDIENLLVSLTNKPISIDLLPYNKLAGGKYSLYNMIYPLENLDKTNNIDNILSFKNSLKAKGFLVKGGIEKC